MNDGDNPKTLFFKIITPFLLYVLNQPVVLTFTSSQLIEINCMICYNAHSTYCSYNPVLYYSLLITFLMCLLALPATSKEDANIAALGLGVNISFFCKTNIPGKTEF
jgi:hypothetical protein